MKVNYITGGAGSGKTEALLAMKKAWGDKAILCVGACTATRILQQMQSRQFSILLWDSESNRSSINSVIRELKKHVEMIGVTAYIAHEA